MRFCSAAVVVVLCLGAAQPLKADDVSNGIDAARGAYGKGDQLHALSALQAAIKVLNGHLFGQFAKMLPPPPDGWEGAAAEAESLDSIGGGLTVTRAYTKGDATLNASLIVDNPAVAASAAMFQTAAQLASKPGWSHLKFGNDDILLRFDATTRSGEIMMLVGDRVLLQIEGNEIAKGDVLIETNKGWNVAGIRKLIGIGS